MLDLSTVDGYLEGEKHQPASWHDAYKSCVRRVKRAFDKNSKRKFAILNACLDELELEDRRGNHEVSMFLLYCGLHSGATLSSE